MIDPGWIVLSGDWKVNDEPLCCLPPGTVEFQSEPRVRKVDDHYEVEYVILVRGPMIGEGI